MEIIEKQVEKVKEVPADGYYGYGYGRRDICAKTICSQDQERKVTLFYNLFILIICRVVVKSLCIFCLFTNNLNEFGTIFALTLNRIIKPQQLWERN